MKGFAQLIREIHSAQIIVNGFLESKEFSMEEIDTLDELRVEAHSLIRSIEDVLADLNGKGKLT